MPGSGNHATPGSAKRFPSIILRIGAISGEVKASTRFPNRFCFWGKIAISAINAAKAEGRRAGNPWPRHTHPSIGGGAPFKSSTQSRRKAEPICWTQHYSSVSSSASYFAIFYARYQPGMKYEINNGIKLVSGWFDTRWCVSEWNNETPILTPEGSKLEKGIHPTLKLNETEGFQCLWHSYWTICIPLNFFCSGNFPTFSLS